MLFQQIKEIFPDAEEAECTGSNELKNIPGWDSLKAINLQMLLEDTYSVDLSDLEWAGNETFEQVESRLAK